MNIYRELIALLAKTPAWAPLLVLPALLVVSAVLFTLLGGRRAYPYLAAAFGAAGFALMSCMTSLSEACFFVGAYASLAALLRLLFFLPRPRKRKKTSAAAREERMYEQFREPLTVLPDLPAASAPEKVCCFEETSAPVEDAPEPSYALKLLEKLGKEKLSPTDRLEADVLGRTVSGLSGRKLTEEESRALNDCLASVLRLTAKYKL